MTVANPKHIFAARIPLNRVGVVVHDCHEDYPPTNVGTDGADSQSQDQSLVLDISKDLENGVMSG